MNRLKKISIILIGGWLIFAIKTPYGGELSIRLNEPSSFDCTTSNYSNMIFSSLIYENFFYLQPNGDIYTHLFSDYFYDKGRKSLTLTLKKNLSFSNGQPVEVQHLKVSLNSFLGRNLTVSKKLSGLINNISQDGRSLYIELRYDYADIVVLLTAPELVLISGDSNQKFSGAFYPAEWVKNRYMTLKANIFYAGGRSFVDKIKVQFFDSFYPDIFLAAPQSFSNTEYKEYPSGVYQNIYICFPKSSGSRNTKIALFTLLKQFVKAGKYHDLNVLTSDEESPVTISMRKTTNTRMKSILRYSNINLYIVSALNSIENDLAEFLRKKGLKFELVFIDEGQLYNFLNTYSINYLLIEKVFTKRMPVEDKITRIVKEMSFNRFSEKYLKLLDELEEIKSLNNSELLMNQVIKIIDTIVNDSFVLPIFQKKFSIIVNKKLSDIDMDGYGRPLLHKVKFYRSLPSK